MRSVSRVAFLAILLLAKLPPVPLFSQEPEKVTIKGTVVNAATGEPVEGVRASLDDLNLLKLTGPDGSFTMTDVPLGPHTLTIQKEGFETRSGRLTVDQAGEMVLPMNPLGGRGGANSEMSRVDGIVRDVDGGNSLDGASVTIRPLGQTRITNSDGRFSFQNIPPGDYQLTVELLGYATRDDPLTVPEKKILSLELDLAVEPIELDPIEVSVEAREMDLEMSGFYDRRGSTSGSFITRERIEERAPLYTSDLFRGIAGVKVVGGLGMGTQNAVVLAGSRALSFNSNPGECSPAVWIDGQMVHQGSSGPGDQGPAFLDQLIQPDRVAGVEIYNSPSSVPVQYNLFAACGVIVFWTRHGG